MYPEPTVGAIILNKNNEILLLKSNRWSNNYIIPGGHIELGEKIEDALKREIMEETNLNIYDIQLLGLQQCINSSSFYEKKHFIFIDFICKTDETDVILNDEHQEYIWVEVNKLDELPMEPFTKKLLNEYKKGNKSKYLKNVLYNYY